VNEFVGLNELCRALKISRDFLKQLADEGNLPYIVGHRKQRLFSIAIAKKSIETYMENHNGARSLHSHQTGADGQGSDSVEEKPGV
jgi:hypothetical protein